MTKREMDGTSQIWANFFKLYITRNIEMARANTNAEANTSNPSKYYEGWLTLRIHQH